MKKLIIHIQIVIEMEEKLSKTFWDVYNNAINMMKERGYSIKDYITDINKFMGELKNREVWLLAERNEDDNTVIYINQIKNKFPKKDLENIVNKRLKGYMNKIGIKKISKLIIVINIEKKKTIDISGYDFEVELIHIKFLLAHITAHKLQPKFIHIDASKRDELEKSLSPIKLVDLPKMMITDPIAIWYGAKIGDVFKVIRMGLPNRLQTIAYREVIDKNISQVDEDISDEE